MNFKCNNQRADILIFSLRIPVESGILIYNDFTILSKREIFRRIDVNILLYGQQAFFDRQWDYICQNIGKMMEYHIYDITTYIGALAACIVMFLVKKHIKNKWVNIILVSCLSFGLYSVCAISSERIGLNCIWSVIAFVAPIAYLTVIGLLRREWIYRVIVYSAILFIGAYNYIYCIINEDHHKMCYTLKIFILAFGIGGFVKNIVTDVKRKKQTTDIDNKNTGEAVTSPEQDS